MATRRQRPVGYVLMKKYLLIAGHNYYPGRGTDDWKGTYETREEAEALITKKEPTYRVVTHGKKKGQTVIDNDRTGYTFNDSNYDWYEIVNLEDFL